MVAATLFTSTVMLYSSKLLAVKQDLFFVKEGKTVFSHSFFKGQITFMSLKSSTKALVLLTGKIYPFKETIALMQVRITKLHFRNILTSFLTAISNNILELILHINRACNREKKSKRIYFSAETQNVVF